MKKSLSLFISSLLLSISSLSLFTTPVSASLDLSGTKYYTAEEMFEFHDVVEAELDAECGPDFSCQEAFFEERAGQEPKYNALKIFLQQVLLATSINPETGDLKLIYHSKDWWSRFNNSFTSQTVKVITKLSLNWREPATSATHPLYSGDKAALGDGWFQPDTELSIHSLSENLNQDTLGDIKYSMKRSDGQASISTSGGFDYSYCLRSPYYQPGLECKPVFGENTDLLYIPYREGVPAHLYQKPTSPQESSDPGNSPDSPSEPEKTLWTVPELAEYEKIAQAEADAACQNQVSWHRSECLWRFREERQQEGGIARAYNSFYHHNFFITAINPSKESIRAYFRDQDPSEREMFGIENPHPVTEAFIVWYDKTYQEDPGVPFMDYLRAGKTIPGMHIIYDSASLGQMPGFFEADREFELIAKDHDISQNASSYLEYFVNNYPMSSYERADYISECLNSPDYFPGKECRLFLDQDGQKHYLPYEALKTEQPSESNPAMEPTPEEPVPNADSSENPHSSDHSASSAPQSADTTSATTLVSNDTARVSSTSAPQNNSSHIARAAAPVSPLNFYRWIAVPVGTTSNSAKSTNDSKDGLDKATSSKESSAPKDTSEIPLSGQIDQGGNKGCASEFPWWFIILVIAVDIAVMWLFWPRRKNETTKSL